MKIAIVGAGPAGLYAGIRLKTRYPDAQIELYEQNASDATFGFGVVFSSEALGFLQQDDAQTYALLAPHLERWQDITLNLHGVETPLDGIGFAAIGRLKLLTLLQTRAHALGLRPHYNHPLTSLDALGVCDLIIGADGVNSLVRTPEFKPKLAYLTNKFAWFGVDKAFPTLSQTFVSYQGGHFNAHHYRYEANKSTFIVECDAQTFTHFKLDEKNESETKAFCEEVFAPMLQGAKLIANKSQWRSFPLLTVEKWHVGNRVLVGDAAHTAHFSIGSGTRLALEDVVALDKALAEHGDISTALVAYEASRRPIVEKLVQAATKSALWYEDFATHMRARPLDFGLNYLTRSGRVAHEKLKQLSPHFMEAYEKRDKVSDESFGAKEIGFCVPETYNASHILFDNFTRNPENIAVFYENQAITYAQLCEKTAQIGNALLALGLTKGDRVLLLLDDTPTYPAALFGAIRAGLVPVLLNTLTPQDLLEFYAQDTGAKVMLADPTFAISLQNVKVIVNHDSAWYASQPTHLECAPTTRDDMAFWMYSSGSTGRPKGIVHLQHDMLYTAKSYAVHILKLTPQDICYSVPKIFFAYGLGNSCTFPFFVGAASILCQGQPKPEAIFETIKQKRPTVFFALPTLYTALVKSEAAKHADTRSLRLCISAAEILADEIAASWYNLTGHTIIEGLGSSEALHIYLSNREEKQKSGAAGLRVEGYELALKTLEGEEVGVNEEGILWVRGHSAAPYYWNRPDKTAETMREDWLYTGDRFVCDADGFYSFKGRADDLVKISGQWVYPLEVELCLANHPHVKECAVLALEMTDRRTTLKAFVVLTQPSEIKELQAFVKAKLTPYKYPRMIEFMEELPKTGTGKIDRQALLARGL